MKYVPSLVLATLTLSTSLWAGQAKVIPPLPAQCAVDVAEKGYCVETSFTDNSFPFTIRYFVVVDKDVYPSSKELLDKYLAFDQYDAYVKTTGNENIVIAKSQSLPQKVNDQGSPILRQYFDYKIKTPLGYLKIRHTTNNETLAVPYEGAVSTTEFAVPMTGAQDVPDGEKALNGAEGLKFQTGSVSTVPCGGRPICSDSQWIVVYETTITPAVNILPKVAASSVEKGITDVIVGMLFNSNR